MNSTNTYINLQFYFLIFKMESESELNSKIKETPQRGCLNFGSKIYPVYEGHNLVGRNPEATINIKNLNVSQQHALITIVDENLHYISDFKSSNGTILDNQKLSPLKLYVLPNGASIKFADIFCTYKKLESGQLINNACEDSQNDNQVLYAASTQELDLPNAVENSIEVTSTSISSCLNINEMPTQVCDIVGDKSYVNSSINIHELPTQVQDFEDFVSNKNTEEKNTHSTSINEIPMQIGNVGDSVANCSNDNDSNDSLDFITMQKVSEWNPNTQFPPAQSSNIEKSESQISDQSQISPVKLSDKKLSNSDTDDELPVASQIFPVQISNKLVLNSDSEDEEMSQICLVKSGAKKALESDTEELITIETAESPNKSKYVLSDDSETDIEDFNEDDNSLKVSDIQKNTSKVSSAISQKVEQSSMIGFKLEISDSEDIEKTLNENEIPPTNAEEKTKDHDYGQDNKIKSSSDTSYHPTTQQIVIPNEDLEVDKIDYPVIEGDLHIQTTQHIEVSYMTEEPGDSQESISNSDKNELTKEKAKNATQESQSLQGDAENSDLRDLELPSLKTHTIENNPITSDSSFANNVDSQTTQNIEMAEITTAIDNLEDNNEAEKNEENILSIQTVPPPLKTSEPNSKEEKCGDSSSNKDIDEDDIYIQPTQQIIENNQNKSLLINTEDCEDIYLQPTQEVQVDSTEIIKKKDISEFSLVSIPEDVKSSPKLSRDNFPTQEKNTETNSSNNVMISTENNDKEFDFKLPRRLDRSIQSKEKQFNDSAISSTSDDDDDDLIQPTQALESMHKELKTTTFAQSEIKNLKPSYVEVQMEALFSSQSDKFVATQQLVDVLEDSFASNSGTDNNNEDIIDDSMLEEIFLPPVKNWSPRKSTSKAKRKSSVTKISPSTEDGDKKEAKKDAIELSEQIVGVSAKGTKKENDSEKYEKPINENQVNIEKEKNNKHESEKQSTTTKRRGRPRKTLPSGANLQEVLEENSSCSKISEDSATDSSKGSQESIGSEKSTNSSSSTKEKKAKSSKDQFDVTKINILKKSDENSKEKDFVNKEKSGEISQQKVKSNTEINEKRSSRSQTKSNSQPDDDLKKSLCVTRSTRKRKKDSSSSLEDLENISEKKKEKNNSVPENKLETVSENTTTSRKTRSKKTNLEDESNDNVFSSRTKENTPETLNKNSEPICTPSKLSLRKHRLRSYNSESEAKKEETNLNEEVESKIPSRAKGETKIEQTVPAVRKSSRNVRKNSQQENDVISVSSSSSIPVEVISISNDDDEPAKKTRRLSANSRALKNEEKVKQKEAMQKNKKSSVPRITTPRRKTEIQMVSEMTPERSKRQLKPKVVFTMMDDAQLESLVRQLGGTVVDTVDSCTVLVTQSVKRTLKLLCAVGQGKPICSPEWIHACKKASSFLDPWNHILVDKEAEKKWQFSLRESLKRSSKKKLLEDYTFQLIVNTAADVLKGAIESCGGKCVTRNLANASTSHKIIVSTNENRNKFAKIVKQNDKIQVIEAEAIFDGTLRQEFNFNKYLLQ